jgi:hypothetical protein
MMTRDRRILTQMTGRALRIALLLTLLACANLRAQTTRPNSNAGLDSLSDDRLMNELAARGLNSLLDRAFEVNQVPKAEQEGRRTLLALRQLSDPSSAKLTAKQRQDLIRKVSAGIEQALPSMNDPESLLAAAKVLVTEGMDRAVNTLEYWGENPQAMAQLRPVAETVVKIYERASQLATQRMNALSANIRGPNDPNAARLEKLDQLNTLATFSARMADYPLALSIDPADPRRKEVAQRGIKYLSELESPDEPNPPGVRLQIGKLQLVNGDYDAAKKVFEQIIKTPAAAPSAPTTEGAAQAPTVVQQYQARYFRAIADVLARRPDDAKKQLDDLLAWQRANLPQDKPTQDGAAAAASMLEYRIANVRAAIAQDPAARQQANQQAIDVLTKLVRGRPDLAPLINELMVAKLPDNADLSTLDPLLLQALVRRGETEARRPESEQADTKTLERAVAAAYELLNRQRKNTASIDPQFANSVSFVLPFLLQRLGREADAANAFLDYVQQHANASAGATDLATAALDNAQNLIGRLRKANADDPATASAYERFLALASAPPFNRKQFAFEYGRRLQLLGKFNEAIDQYKQVPPDDKRQLATRFFQMIATKQLVDQLPAKAPQRGALLSDLQTLADQVTQAAAADLSAAQAKNDQPAIASAKSMLVRTKLLAADAARVDRKEPAQALKMLDGFEQSAQGLPNENALLSEALLIRVQSYMALGQNTQATDALVKLLGTREGGQGAAIVYSLLEKLNADFDQAQAAGDTVAMRTLAKNRAQLSGFLVDWAKNNPDERIKKFTYRYRVFEADTKHRAADVEEDPAARRAGWDAALKLYQSLETPEALDEYRATLSPDQLARLGAYDPAVTRGIANLAYDLGDYAEAQKRFAILFNDGRLGSAMMDVESNGQTRTVDNDAYWEAVLKLIRSNLKLNADVERQRTFLKTQYVRWGDRVGGTKWKAEFEALRKELIPDFNPKDLDSSTTAPTTSATTQSSA